MVISRKHRYLFIELPRTGSTAISNELCKHYGGQRILHKHATYREFMKTASEDEKDFFVFSGIRNPLDKIVSLYFKYKTNKRGYDDPQIYTDSNMFISWLTKTQFNFVDNNDVKFADFFNRFYFIPYNDWSSLDHKHLDFVIHFERIEEDFVDVLQQIGIEPQRPLPVVNKTGERDSDFWLHYTPDIRNRAIWVFGPYLRRWGYTLPDAWAAKKSHASEIAFIVANIFRQIYWQYLR